MDGRKLRLSKWVIGGQWPDEKMCKNCFAIMMGQMFFFWPAMQADAPSVRELMDGDKKKREGLMVVIMLDGYLNDATDRAGQWCHLATIWDLPAAGWIFFHHDSFLFILEISVADPWYFGVDPDADPCLWLMDPDPDPAIFVIDLQDASKKLIFFVIFCLLLFEGTFTSFFKEKSQK
jgi:hypothetical protein